MKALSSQGFIVVRSMTGCLGKTSASCGRRGPEKVSAATVLRMTGTLNALAVLASPTVALTIAVRSPLWLRALPVAAAVGEVQVLAQLLWSIHAP
jgi:hypothetical protein